MEFKKRCGNRTHCKILYNQFFKKNISKDETRHREIKQKRTLKQHKII